MKFTRISTAALLLLFFVFSCQQADPSEPEVPKAPEWVDGYPQGVTVEEFTDTLSNGKKCLGFIATIDFKKNPYLKFNCCASSHKKVTSEFFADLNREEDGTPALAVNAGYFGSSSVSLLYTNGKCSKISTPSFSWPTEEACECTIYPVRSALGQMADGHFEIQWTYCTNIAKKNHFAYPSALDNNEKTRTFMPEGPGEDWPGAYLWEPVEAAGAGPRLVQDGKNVAEENYWAECLDSGGTAAFSRVNRTAAGLTADGKLILIVVDGRGMRGSAGCTLPYLADKFIALGCTDAMNFDGGGSSTMVGADGKVLNAPSDSDGERKVPTAIVISELVPEE